MFGQLAQEIDWVFKTQGHTEAINRLLYLVEKGEVFSLLEGGSGTGKSTVLRRTAEELASTGRRPLRQNVASLDCRATLWHLCGSLSIFCRSGADPSELMMMVRDELLARAGCRYQTVVMLDDVDFAQENIGSVLHLLTSIAEASDGQISVIAAAERPLTFSLRKGTALRVRLEPLPELEAVEFALRRLAHLNCPVEQITDTGWQAITDLACGLPAQLLRICQILHVVTSMEAGPIDKALVQNAARELLPRAA